MFGTRLNPDELRLIVDALDHKHRFQLQSGEGGVAISRAPFATRY
jgi:hypothetical protein